MEPKELLTSYRFLCEHFNRSDYPKCFEYYMNEIRPFFNGLESSLNARFGDPDASALDPDDPAFESDASANEAGGGAYREDVLLTYIDPLLDEVEKNRDSFRWKFQKIDAFEKDKIVLLLFLAPALVKLGTPLTLAFADKLAEIWNSRFPDSTFKVGDYDTIMEGFKWKWTARR